MSMECILFFHANNLTLCSHEIVGQSTPCPSNFQVLLTMFSYRNETGNNINWNTFLLSILFWAKILTTTWVESIHDYKKSLVWQSNDNYDALIFFSSTSNTQKNNIDQYYSKVKFIHLLSDADKVTERGLVHKHLMLLFF